MICKKKRAFTLVETLVAMCVSTMLILGLGTSFYMFRVSNKDAILDAKNEQYYVAIKDYITNHADEIVESQLGKAYFTANIKSIYTTVTDEEGNIVVDEETNKPVEYLNDYYIYLEDQRFYLTPDQSVLETKNSVAHIGDITIRDAAGNPIKTVNGEYVVGFSLPDYYQPDALEEIRTIDENGVLHYDYQYLYNTLPFFIYGYKNKEEVETITEFEPVEIGEEETQEEQQEFILLNKLDLANSIYYSDEFRNSNDILSDKFRFEDEVLYRKTGRFSVDNGEVTFEEIEALKDLPLDDLNVSFEVSTDRFQIANIIDPETEQPIMIEQKNEYGDTIYNTDGSIEYKYAVKSYPIYTLEVVPNNTSYGVAYVESTNASTMVARLIAKECFRLTEKNEDASDLTEDDIRAFFEYYNFENVVYMYEKSDTVEEGHVISYDEFNMNDINQVINVVISLGNGEENPEVEPEPTDPIEEDKPEDGLSGFYSHRFIGWYTEDGTELSKEYEYDVDIPRDGVTVAKYIAKFEDKETRLESVDKYSIDEKQRFTITSKTVFIVKCNLSYTINGIERNNSFVVKSYVKYLPELHKDYIEE